MQIRIGQADCEIWFGEPRGRQNETKLFHDYLLPISSPENTRRVSALPSTVRLEGFPLLHLDCYRSDPASIGWPEWTSKYGYRKTAAERGIRYSHVLHALEAVYSNAGMLICGLALVQTQLDSGQVSLPFTLNQGSWTGHAYHISFTDRALRSTQFAQFRTWLLAQSSETRMYLEEKSGQIKH